MNRTDRPLYDEYAQARYFDSSDLNEIRLGLSELSLLGLLFFTQRHTSGICTHQLYAYVSWASNRLKLLRKLELAIR